MSRAILTAWHALEFAPGPYPERPDASDNKVDRWAGSLLGRARLALRRFELARVRRFAQAVEAIAPALRDAEEPALRQRIERLREALPRDGLSDALIAECFALVREVSARRLGLRHFPVQVMGGYAMLRGRLAEMQTGEGKTITALLPAVVLGLARVPVHVITVNEYLARRDAEMLRPVYDFFGLSVGLIEPGQELPARRAAYGCDIAYCTNKDVVFDYLRDRIGARRGLFGARQAVSRMLGRGPGSGDTLLRGLYFAVVDEADSVLIDEARTPLIISDSAKGGAEEEIPARALAIAGEMRPGVHYAILTRERGIELTAEGKALAAELTQGVGGVWAASRAREELCEQALAALRLYERDKHYILQDGKVQIVDEYTGRVMPDRSWERGLHQMIECKEGLALTGRRETLSRISYQRYFRRYLKLCGMTGTGTEVAGEMRAVYGLDVLRIPTHRPSLRRYLGTRVFASADERWDAVVESARRMHGQGRPVLIGTRSVAASETVAARLAAAGLGHSVLNARQDQEEAQVIGRAGQAGCITVATNMAGRGTDIQLAEGVAERGGLHVIVTEFHESRRIDRQLLGRAGRQGDPGSGEALVSLDDELFRVFAPGALKLLRGAAAPGRPITGWRAGLLRRLAQSAAESQHSRTRRQTLQNDRSLERMLAFSGRKE